MRLASALCLAALTTLATNAFAEFEGRLEMKMTVTTPDGNGGGGTAKVAVGKAGTRSVMDMQMGEMGMKMDILVKNDDPTKIYRINEGSKTYTIMNVPQGANAEAKDDAKYTVEKLGEEKILGYNTQHVKVTRNGVPTELWTSKDVLDYATFSKLQSGPANRRMHLEGMNKALKDAGAEGMPLRSVMNTEEGAKATMEVTKITKESVPADTFAIPAGYTQSEGGMMDMMQGMSGPKADEARRKMDDAMKNMTPEQREMIQRMMKQRGGGQ